MFRIENGELEPVALRNVPEVLERHLTARGRIKPRTGSTMERVIRTKNVVHVVDLLQDADGAKNPASKYGNARTYLAYGPKRTYGLAPHMSAFGGKADMALYESPLSRSLLGVKRTWAVARHMSAYDPKRTSRVAQRPRFPYS